MHMRERQKACLVSRGFQPNSAEVEKFENNIDFTDEKWYSLFGHIRHF